MTSTQQPTEQSVGATEQPGTEETTTIQAGTEQVIAQDQPVVQEPALTQEPQLVSGVVVESSSAPAGKEASAAVVASITAQTTAVPEPTRSAFEKKLEKLMVSGTNREKMVISSLRTYVETMKPAKPTSDKEGVASQINLFRLFQNITRQDESFKECMDLFIEFFREHKDGAFHEHYAFRFTEFMTISSEQIKAFTYMVNLLKIAASTKSKKDVQKMVDISRSINETYTEEQRQRVLAYFS